MDYLDLWSLLVQHFCYRFCLTVKSDFQTVFTEDDPNLILRSKHLHVVHCNALLEDPET